MKTLLELAEEIAAADAAAAADCPGAPVDYPPKVIDPAESLTGTPLHPFPAAAGSNIALPAVGPAPPPPTKIYYINVDSRSRNRAIWPGSERFEVKLDPPPQYSGAQIPRSFRNVVSIELTNATFPNTNGVLSQPYLYLNILEIDGNLDTTANGSRYFAKLIPDKALGVFIYTYADAVERPKKVFPFRGTRLDKLTLELRDPDGALFSFGVDTVPPAAPIPSLQTSFTFKITVEENNRDGGA